MQIFLRRSPACPKEVPFSSKSCSNPSSPQVKSCIRTGGGSANRVKMGRAYLYPSACIFLEVYSLLCSSVLTILVQKQEICFRSQPWPLDVLILLSCSKAPGR